MRKMPTGLACDHCRHHWTTRAKPSTTLRCPQCRRPKRVPALAGVDQGAGVGPVTVRPRPAAPGPGVWSDESGGPVDQVAASAGRPSLVLVDRPKRSRRPVRVEPDQLEPDTIDQGDAVDVDQGDAVAPGFSGETSTAREISPRPLSARYPYAGFLLHTMLTVDAGPVDQVALAAPVRPLYGTLPDQVARPVLRPAPVTGLPATSTRAPGPVRFRTGDAAGRCEVYLSTESGPCSRGADGTRTFTGRSVCAFHYDTLRGRWPGECAYHPQTGTAPESSEAYWLE